MGQSGGDHHDGGSSSTTTTTVHRHQHRVSSKAQSAEIFRRFLSPASGIICIMFGILLIIVAILVLLIPRRIAMFWFILGVGIGVLIMGIVCLVIKCCCPDYLPERRTCEKYVCCCIP